MSSRTIATAVKMLESLSESAQDRAVEHLREYIKEMQDELEWDRQFKKSKKGLVAVARRAKKAVSEGRAKPMDYDRL
jgi:hypothetical protein